MLWLDRGVLRRLDRPFDAFEDWRDTVWEEEDTQRHKLDRKIKAEARWAVEGISARRKRNMGRVRALQALRADRVAQIRRQGTAALALEAGTPSGRKVIEATGITKTFGDRTVLRPLSLRVLRGDRIAFVGPNGAGKTTLLRLLTGDLAPDAGTVSMGTGLEIAVFDQARAALDPQMTLWDSLTQDPALRGGSSDQVMVRGVARHVVGYLKDFLFDEAQARAPVRALSGGERARLLLARIMARPSNLLVLDEPTNDLDVETLDLLQDVLGEYDGTVLIVSHDRDFLDRVATQTVWLGGDGRATVYAGGWTDMRAQGGGPVAGTPEVSARPSPVSVAATASKAPPGRSLSFTERHRLDALPAEIDRLTAEIGKLTGLLADADLFAREPVKFRKATEALAERQARLAAAEEEWLALAERAEG
jgi:ATP-binding cassette subfamily F protein uup